jgi:GNAT superfamily N-acetyltransferase
LSTPSITIRAAERDDIAAITALLSELNMEEGYDMSASAEALTKALFVDTRIPMRALVALSDGKLVGLTLHYWGYDTVSASYGLHLADIVVTKLHRAKRIGTQLFTQLARECLREGGQWISLTVKKRNLPAQEFYKARGMVEVAVNFFAIGPVALSKCANL